LYNDRQYDPKAHEKENIPYMVRPSPSHGLQQQNYKHHMKNEDKIDESHKLQLKFEYEI